MTKPKIITLDIETSPILAFVWSLWKQNIGTSQIVRDWTILSWCAKTLGEKGYRYFDVAEQDDVFDDRAIMQALWTELDEADIVVTQNGIRFDHRKINARFIQLGFPPPSPFKMIDTKVEASKVAMFTSNKLEWLAAILTDTKKDKHNQFPGWELWLECMKKNPKAWASMRKYNPKDVLATEKVYLKLRPWMEGHPNLGVYVDTTDPVCPKCGSRHIQHRGSAFTQVGEYLRFWCKSCKGWSRSRYVINSLAKRKALLSN